MNVTARINKVIRTLGVMGIMMAMAGFLAANTAPASAASIGSSTQPMPRVGQVIVYAQAQSPATDTVVMDVVIFDAKGNSVAKGKIYGDGKFSAQLISGEYKVQVSAKGYTTFNQDIRIDANTNTIVKIALVPNSDPAITDSDPTTY